MAGFDTHMHMLKNCNERSVYLAITMEEEGQSLPNSFQWYPHPPTSYLNTELNGHYARKAIKLHLTLRVLDGRECEKLWGQRSIRKQTFVKP